MEPTTQGAALPWRGRRLVLHIGAGKTGTTAIQKALHADAQALEGRRVVYLGLMFERARQRLFQWQQPAAIAAFHALPELEAAREFGALLRECLRASDLDATLVLSNESFFGQNAAVIRALAPFVEGGLDLTVIAYVRRHDQWAKSAFIQWGIRHKTYVGPQKSFGEWDNPERNAFYPKLQTWLDAFGERVLVRNYDAVEDVVSDFYAVVGLGARKSPERTYQAPQASELVLRALFNQLIPGQSSPERFEELFGSTDAMAMAPLGEWLGGLLPSEEELGRVIEATTADRGQVNAVLLGQGQPPLSTTTRPQRPVEIDPEAMLVMMLQALVRQSGELHRLQARLERLEHERAAEGDGGG